MKKIDIVNKIAKIDSTYKDILFKITPYGDQAWLYWTVADLKELLKSLQSK